MTVFRNQLPKDLVERMLPAVVKHLSAQSAVVHTYAGICIEKTVMVRESAAQGIRAARFDPAALRAHLLPAVEPILQTIAAQRGIPMNEYLMRALARIFSFLKMQAGDAAMPTLRPLSSIILAVAENPSNPVFNHNLFEAMAAILKIVVPAQTDAVEAVLLPVCGQILERNVADFLPYTFQILGLLLDGTQSVKPLYQNLFARLLTPDLWRAQANIPGLVRLMRAYFGKHAVFADTLRSSMQSILERFQFCLCNRKTEAAAFELLRTIFGQLPFEIYQTYVQTLMTVLLTRLQSKPSPRLQKDFVITMSLFVYKDPALSLPGVLGQIQA